MDPRQQSPRPQQRTSYISDFVSTPRGSGAPSAAAANSAATTSDTSPRPANTPSSQPYATPQLARSAPASTAALGQSDTTTPNRSSSKNTSISDALTAPDISQPLGSTTSAATSSTTTTPKRESFAPPKTPEIEPREKKVTSKNQGLKDILSIVGVLASALVLAFCLITFVFQSYQVDGPSMQTTLQNNDHLIVWKIPKTIAKLTGQEYIPNRGDVIIFNEPGSAVGGADKQLIKRVLALPGDRIVVKDSAVTVYNNDYPNGFNPDRTLPYGSVITDTPGNVDVTLKEGQVFAVGDNRTNSLDSRVFGPIDADQIVGKLIIRILPLNGVKKF